MIESNGIVGGLAMTPLEEAAIDYEAMARRLIVECEEWRSRYNNARYDLAGEIAYYARLALDFIREPNNQMLVWFAGIILIFAFRHVVSFLNRRRFKRL